jgi:hypothetical protein
VSPGRIPHLLRGSGRRRHEMVDVEVHNHDVRVTFYCGAQMVLRIVTGLRAAGIEAGVHPFPRA